MPHSPAPDPLSLEALHGRFLAILSRIRLHGCVYFRHLRSDRRQEAVAEMVALSWMWFVRLARRDKDASQFPATLASFAARAVRSGRRLCGQERSKDVLSSLAQQRHGFTLSSIPDGSTLSGSVFDDALRDNTQSPPDEQVAFRLDFPAWLLTLTERDRRVIADLMLGERTLDVADKYGMSAGRVSQLRREFMADWRRFIGEAG
jgi:hypothetical protein